jgi:hypothetical protein
MDSPLGTCWMDAFFLNMLAFACLPFIFPHARNRHLVWLLLLLPPFISLIFYFYFPYIEAYAGFQAYCMVFIQR